jgi:hypothetical protein
MRTSLRHTAGKDALAGYVFSDPAEMAEPAHAALAVFAVSASERASLASRAAF